MAKMYISCPITEPVESLIEAARLLDSYGHKVDYWNRGPVYDEEPLRSCDGVVFIIHDFGWSLPLTALPSGVKKELNIAQTLDKELFVMYRRTIDKNLRLYPAKLEYGSITGYGYCTRGNITRSMMERIYNTNDTDAAPDRRILLLLTNS